MQRIVTATDALRPTWRISRIRSRRTERVRFAMPGAFEPFPVPAVHHDRSGQDWFVTGEGAVLPLGCAFPHHAERATSCRDPFGASGEGAARPAAFSWSRRRRDGALLAGDRGGVGGAGRCVGAAEAALTRLYHVPFSPDVCADQCAIISPRGGGPPWLELHACHQQLNDVSILQGVQGKPSGH
jgi:hypothetical protein